MGPSSNKHPARLSVALLRVSFPWYEQDSECIFWCTYAEQILKVQEKLSMLHLACHGGAAVVLRAITLQPRWNVSTGDRHSMRLEVQVACII